MWNDLDPYEKRSAQITTWMLCAKRLSICKDVAKYISKMIPLDLRGVVKWEDGEVEARLIIWYRGPYEWIWNLKDDIHGRAPCNICLRPCSEITNHQKPLMKCGFNIVPHSCWICPVHGILRSRNCETKKNVKPGWNDFDDGIACGHFGICLHCFSKNFKNVMVEEIYNSNPIVDRSEKVMKKTACLDGLIEYK
jgi:hypothetical protein